MSERLSLKINKTKLQKWQVFDKKKSLNKVSYLGRGHFNDVYRNHCLHFFVTTLELINLPISFKS